MDNKQALDGLERSVNADRQHEVDAKIADLRRLIDAGERKYKMLLKDHGTLTKKLADIGFIDGRGVHRHAIRPIAPSGKGETTAVLQVSDVHAFCRVRRQDTQGFNEYNPDICRARLDRLWKKSLSLIQIEASRVRIPHLVVAVLGDLLENMIHPDAAETNYGTPAQEVVFLRDAVYPGIDFLLHRGGFSRITFVLVVGNHDRDSHKLQHTNAAERSYLKMFYDYLLRDYADPKTGIGRHGKTEVEVVVAGGEKIVVDLYGKPYRFGHRSEFRYRGGVGGPTIGINRILNAELPVECDFSAHLHCHLPLPKCKANGSVIGHSAFSDFIGVKPEKPTQNLTYIDCDLGVTDCRPVFLDKD